MNALSSLPSGICRETDGQHQDLVHNLRCDLYFWSSRFGGSRQSDKRGRENEDENLNYSLKGLSNDEMDTETYLIYL